MTTPRSPRERRISVLCCVLAAVLSACGSPDAADVASAPADGQPRADEPGPTTTPDVTVQAGGPNRAVIVIGRQRYRADLSDDLSICRAADGAIIGSGRLDGFADGRIEIHLPPPGWEDAALSWRPPTIVLDLGTDADGTTIGLYAGGDVVADHESLDGASQIDSYEIDGVGATGAASFVDHHQVEGARDGSLVEPATLTGTFAIECD